jgi:IS605 OrfB family transposase
MEARRKARCETKGWTYRPKTIRKPAVCKFEQPLAMFLVGKRGRDADFRKDGTLSIWTVGGRKRLDYQVVPDHLALFQSAKEIDSVTVLERNGRLIGKVAITLEVPEPKGVVPVGIDLNETNALVAVDADGRKLFVTGHQTKVKNRRTAKTCGRLQQKLAAHKAERHDTRSVRRVLKRLGRKRSRRTRDFARCAAKTLIQWAPQNAVLVFEDLQMQQPMKGQTKGATLRRRLSLWQHGAIRQAVTCKAEMAGISVAFVNPAYTSKTCSKCGLRGNRKRHSFVCHHCGHTEHADVNAAINIRNRFVQFRLDGVPSATPEALSQDKGKLPALAGSS